MICEMENAKMATAKQRTERIVYIPIPGLIDQFEEKRPQLSVIIITLDLKIDAPQLSQCVGKCSQCVRSKCIYTCSTINTMCWLNATYDNCLAAAG